MAATTDPMATTPWATVAARFLGRSERRAGSALWPLLLMRGFPFGLLEPPPDAVETYRRTWWRRLPPDEPCAVDAELAWVRTEGGSTEVAVASVARLAGSAVAGNVVVLRCAGLPARPSGVRRVPPPPVVGEVGPGRRFVVDADQVERLGVLLGRGSPVTDSDTYAHHQGFPSALTPSLVLLHRAYDRSADWGETGAVELWLSRPIPRGAITEVCRSTTDPDCTVLRVIGRDAPAAIGRRTAEVGGGPQPSASAP